MMKRKAAAWILLFLFLLGVPSCGKPLPVSEGAGNATEQAVLPLDPDPVPETGKTVDLPAVPRNVTKKDLEAIPVARADMTADELREICLRYMTLEKSVYWTLNSDVTFRCDYAGAADRDGNLHWKAGTLYRGIPYSPASLDLSAFLDQLEEGVMDTASAPGGEAAAARMGNVCNTACYWAWARVTTLPFASMTPKNGYRSVGPYTSTPLAEFSGNYGTDRLCERNGPQTLFESYAAALPADGLITKSDSNGGHTRMVLEKPRVVRLADGSIDGAASVLFCIEQTSRTDPVESENGEALAFLGVRVEYRFEELFRDHYVPFTLPEFSGERKVAPVELSLKNGDPETLSDLMADTVLCNYAVARLDLSVQKADSGAVLEGRVFVGASGAQSVNVSRTVSFRERSRALTQGERYRVILTARISNGETRTVYDGELPA